MKLNMDKLLDIIKTYFPDESDDKINEHLNNITRLIDIFPDERKDSKGVLPNKFKVEIDKLDDKDPFSFYNKIGRPKYFVAPMVD